MNPVSGGSGALAGLAEGLARAHAAYGAPGAVVVFVVQPEERNALDQELLRQARSRAISPAPPQQRARAPPLLTLGGGAPVRRQRLWSAHGVRVVTRTLLQIAQVYLP